MNSLNQLKVNPKQIFLLDALGALLTSVMLFGILAQFEAYFGMPKNVLHLLSGVAFCFFIYSLSCYRLLKARWKSFLLTIMICNSIYAIVSLGVVVKYFENLTALGLTYFIIELMVIALVVTLEYKVYVSQA